MLIDLFCILLILYLLAILVDIIHFSFRCFIRKDCNNCLVISKSIHYLCSTLTSIVVVALLLNLMDFDTSIWWFYIIFGIAVFISMPLMFVVVFWKVTWSNETLYYRNPLGHWKTYNIEDVHLISRKQYTTIMYGNKKVTDYNFMLLYIGNVKDFEMLMKKHKLNSTKK